VDADDGEEERGLEGERENDTGGVVSVCAAKELTRSRHFSSTTLAVYTDRAHDGTRMAFSDVSLLRER
jgi:hypothetical protein